MTDRLSEIKIKKPHLVGEGEASILRAQFEFKASVPVETQLSLCRDFSVILGGAQDVRITAASEAFMAVSINPKNGTFPYTAEVLEVCANGSMFDIIADTYGLRSLDFADEDYEGGIDYSV